MDKLKIFFLFSHTYIEHKSKLSPKLPYSFNGTHLILEPEDKLKILLFAHPNPLCTLLSLFPTSMDHISRPLSIPVEVSKREAMVGDG